MAGQPFWVVCIEHLLVLGWTQALGMNRIPWDSLGNQIGDSAFLGVWHLRPPIGIHRSLRPSAPSARSAQKNPGPRRMWRPAKATSPLKVGASSPKSRRSKTPSCCKNSWRRALLARAPKERHQLETWVSGKNIHVWVSYLYGFQVHVKHRNNKYLVAYL